METQAYSTPLSLVGRSLSSFGISISSYQTRPYFSHICYARTATSVSRTSSIFHQPDAGIRLVFVIQKLCETYIVHKAFIQGVSASALLGGVICGNEFSEEDILVFRELGTNTRKRISNGRRKSKKSTNALPGMRVHRGRALGAFITRQSHAVRVTSRHVSIGSSFKLHASGESLAIMSALGT